MIPRMALDRTVLGTVALLKDISDITLHDIEPKKFRDCLAECLLFRGIRMQQFAHKQNLGRVEGLSQLCFSEVIVVAAKGNAVELGQVIQHGQEVETFRIPLLFVVGTDLVALQKLGDEGDIAHLLKFVAGGAFKQLERGAHGFFCKHGSTSSDNLCLM